MLQDIVPHENVAVERPVIIVRGTAVMGLAGTLEVVADLHKEHGGVLPADGILPLLAGHIGPAVLQLLRGDEVHLAIQLGVQAGESDLQSLIGLTYSAHDCPDGLAQVLLCTVFPGDDLLPVPLVYIDRVGVVHLFVPADGVHIGKQALAYIELVFLQRKTLPLGQRVNYLRIGAHIGDVKGYGALHAIEVIVQT